MSPLFAEPLIDDGARLYAAVARDIDFQKAKAIAMACDSGATVPAAPVDGQWFRHAPTGRNVLMMYTAASGWLAMYGFGAIIAFVDFSLGTNSVDMGGASGAGAYKTLGFALSNLPPVVNGAVTITVAKGTYTDLPLVPQIRTPIGQTVTIACNEDYAGTPETIVGHDGGTVGTSCLPGPYVQPTITRSSGTWTANAYRGMLISIEGSMSVKRVVDDNTTTVIRLCGALLPSAPLGTDTITIQPQSSVAGTEAVILTGGFQTRSPTTITGAKFTSGNVSVRADTTFTRCVSTAPVNVLAAGVTATLSDCSLTAQRALDVSPGAIAVVNRCKLRNSGTGTFAAARASGGGVLRLGAGTSLDGSSSANSIAVLATVGGTIIFTAAVTNAMGVLIENATLAGLRALDFGIWYEEPSATVAHQATFLNCTRNVDGEASFTAQTGAISVINLASSVPAGVYRIDVYHGCIVAGTGGTLSTTIGWTDDVGAKSDTPASNVVLTSTANYGSGYKAVRLASGTITFETSVTAPTGSPQYNVYVRLNRVAGL